MRFTLANERVVIGHRITVRVVASSKESIARVVTRLDGSKLGDDRLEPAEVQYERIFEQAGGAGPGREHVLAVTASSADGVSETASRRWQDSV